LALKKALSALLPENQSPQIPSLKSLFQ